MVNTLQAWSAWVLAFAGKPPPEGAEPSYMQLLERHSNVIYPALAVVVVLLLIIGIVDAWRTQDLDGLQKVELKREIILELRRQVGGASAETLARAVGLESFKTVKLLEELQRDGILVSHTNTARLTVWRIKGAGGPTPVTSHGTHSRAG